MHDRLARLALVSQCLSQDAIQLISTVHQQLLQDLRDMADGSADMGGRLGMEGRVYGEGVTGTKERSKEGTFTQLKETSTTSTKKWAESLKEEALNSKERSSKPKISPAREEHSLAEEGKDRMKNAMLQRLIWVVKAQRRHHQLQPLLDVEALVAAVISLRSVGLSGWTMSQMNVFIDYLLVVKKSTSVNEVALDDLSLLRSRLACQIGDWWIRHLPDEEQQRIKEDPMRYEEYRRFISTTLQCMYINNPSMDDMATFLSRCHLLANRDRALFEEEIQQRSFDVLSRLLQQHKNSKSSRSIWRWIKHPKNIIGLILVLLSVLSIVRARRRLYKFVMTRLLSFVY